MVVLQHQRIIRETVAEAMRKSADPALDLVFLHLPVPHDPFFYDARTGQDAVHPDPVMGYLDHLELGDRVLGQIRRAMNESGVAAWTTLVVSSDHWNRMADQLDGKMDHRVPFLVNFPVSTRGLQYAPPFNTILTRSFITAIMNREIRTPQEAAQWLDRTNGALTDSPYNRN